MKYTGTIKDEQGKAHTLNLDLLPITVQPPVEPEPEPEPEQPTTTDAPLSYNDGRFSGNATAPSTKIPNGGTLSNKTITDTGQIASIVTGSGATIKNCRVKSREGIRIGGGGNFLIDGCYIEVNGSGNDHADGLQAYSPGSKGVIKVRNTTFKTGTTAVNTGFFIADNWTGTIDWENVVIWGGPYGAKIHPDVGGDNIIRFKNVFVVGPFTWGGLLIDERTLGGHVNKIELWENVRNATIVDGKLIPGTVIPRP